MSNTTDIIIVEACKPKAGDLLVLCTNESLSKDVIYDIRGRLAEKFDDAGIDFVIISGTSITHITKEALLEHYHSNRAT